MLKTSLFIFYCYYICCQQQHHWWGRIYESIDVIILSHVLGLEIDRPLTSKSLSNVLSTVFFDLPLTFY